MAIFTNSFDLNVKTNKLLKKISKKYLSKKKTYIDKVKDISSLENIVTVIVNNHIRQLNIYVNYYEKQKDLLEVANEDVKKLLDIFNMNNFVKEMDILFTDEIRQLFNNNDKFRRDLLYTSIFEIIKKGGANKGAEYALIFAKAFNFDYAIAMSYASYDSDVNNPRLEEFINKYLELGGSKDVYWLPNYFKKDDKTRFNMEELRDVIEYIDNNKSAKKLHYDL